MVIVRGSNLLALFACRTSRARTVFPRRATSRSISSLEKCSPPKLNSLRSSFPNRVPIVGLVLVGFLLCPSRVLPDYSPQFQAMNSCRGEKDFLERGKTVNGGKPCEGDEGPCAYFAI
jgi:hypothetical protein